MNIDIPSQREIIDYYGKDDRTTVVMEELAEFAKAVSKYKRYVLNNKKYENDTRHNESEIRENLKEEIADVLICIRIMQEITGISDSEIEEEISRKDDRNSLLCRIAQLRDAQSADKKKGKNENGYDDH
jgi:NTP pyrophosphatase (non-canonical NTP hydrolase)